MAPSDAWTAALPSTPTTSADDICTYFFKILKVLATRCFEAVLRGGEAVRASYSHRPTASTASLAEGRTPTVCVRVRIARCRHVSRSIVIQANSGLIWPTPGLTISGLTSDEPGRNSNGRSKRRGRSHDEQSSRGEPIEHGCGWCIADGVSLKRDVF